LSPMITVVVTVRGACDWPLALAGERTSDDRSGSPGARWRLAAGGDGDRYLFNSLDIPYPRATRNTQIQSTNMPYHGGAAILPPPPPHSTHKSA
jgi:hypothetical protein